MVAMIWSEWEKKHFIEFAITGNCIFGYQLVPFLIDCEIPKKLDHSKCRFSTGIHEGITAGQGKLDDYGFFEFPCEECAQKAQKHLDESKSI